MYRHQWGRPYYAVTPAGKYKPLQECPRCGTFRNPVNGAIVRRGRSHCWDAEPKVDAVELHQRVRDLVKELRFIESAGETVLWHHGSKRETERETPTLL